MTALLDRFLKPLFWKLGVEVGKYNIRNNFGLRRNFLLRHLDVDMIVDVGAFQGDFIWEVRAHGYKGRILAFEPQPLAFKELKRRIFQDPKVKALKLAASNRVERKRLNLTSKAYSSSFLLPNAIHQKAGRFEIVGSIDVECVPIDDLLNHENFERAYLKIDVQGFEKIVLEGVENHFYKIAGVELEVSLRPLFDHGPSFEEIRTLMAKQGFLLSAIRPGFSNHETGELLQADMVFLRDQD